MLNPLLKTNNSTDDKMSENVSIIGGVPIILNEADIRVYCVSGYGDTLKIVGTPTLKIRY